MELCLCASVVVLGVGIGIGIRPRVTRAGSSIFFATSGYRIEWGADPAVRFGSHTDGPTATACNRGLGTVGRLRTGLSRGRGTSRVSLAVMEIIGEGHASRESQ